MSSAGDVVRRPPRCFADEDGGGGPEAMTMQSEISMVRGASLIVVVGIVLGVAYNATGLRGHPPRGIPWIASADTLTRLESGAPPGPREATTAPSPTEAPYDRARPATARSPSASPTSRGSAPAAEAKPPAATRAAEPAPPPGDAPGVSESDRPREVDLAMARRFFESGSALFLDAREAADFEAGHIPGAVRLTRDDVLADPGRVATLPIRGRPIITYCEGGACEASLDLAKTLVDAGLRKVLVYSGGFPEWAAAGRPIERGGAR
jgi:rhodanese-related sulfurtransferase